MNVIFVLMDSINRHCLEPYGGALEVTPNWNRLAARGVRFDNHFVGSLPCMPARRELFTGRKDFLWRPWGHLEPFDAVLPDIAANQGYKTMMITDHYHYWQEGAHGYTEAFQGTEFIRGYERDNWNVDPVESVPQWVQAINRWRPNWGTRYYQNVRHFQDETDFFSARVFQYASEWLQNNYGHTPFYLHVESFGAHEPFHLPEPYRSMWTKHGQVDFTIWPPYQDSNAMAQFFQHVRPEELDFIRSQYLGKLTMLDHWFGTLLDTLDRLNAWEDTMVVATTDHGHELGERRVFGKSHPHFGSHAHIPLVIWHPNLPKHLQDGSLDALTQTVDLNPTVIQAMGVSPYEAPHGRSLMNLLLGKTTHHREAVLYGTFGQGAGCTTLDYTLLQGFTNQQAPLYLYSSRLPRLPRGHLSALREIACGQYIPGVDWPVWRIPWAIDEGPHSGETVLYRRLDPMFKERNLCGVDVMIHRRMNRLIKDMMAEEGTPPEQFYRMGLSRHPEP